MAKYVGFLNTPPIWKKKQFDIQQFEFPNLVLDSFQPQSIPINIRLGHQMEYVFKQLVEYSAGYEVLVHNLVIRHDKRTLGEIDFILHDIANDKLIHIELTCKFYIIDPDISEPIQSIIGPNRRDKFFSKMEKIKNVQFPLLHSVEGAKALKNINIDHLEVEHQCCFKAQLFYPFGASSINIGPLNKECLSGYWLRFEDFNNQEFEASVFYIPTKSEWVTEPNIDVEWKSHFEVRTDINILLLKEFAPMVWAKNDKDEFDRFFIVWW